MLTINRLLQYMIQVLVVSLITTANSFANPLQEWQQPEYIQKAFNEIALKNEYRQTEQRILKWHKPIYYSFHYHDLPQHTIMENLFKEHFKQLAEITNHPIDYTQTNKANLIIHLTKDANYGNVIREYTPSKVTNLERESHCMGSFTTNKSKQIIHGHIVLPMDHIFSRGLLVSCVIEESTQLMGLPNDSDWVNPSIANDATKLEFLTGLDYLFLKILYDKRLQAGMSYKQSQPIIETIITDLNKRGEVNRAQLKVRQSGLYPITN